METLGSLEKDVEAEMNSRRGYVRSGIGIISCIWRLSENLEDQNRKVKGHEG